MVPAPPLESRARGVQLADCRWFWVWALLGSTLALGFVSLGVLVLAPAALLGAVIASRPASRRSAYGLVSGIGLVLLFIAWVQRAGPLNPLPWLLAGLALFVAGVVAQVRQRQ